MKTILVFSWFYLPYVGGAELFLKAITDRLSDRFRFVIVTARADRRLPAREDHGSITILRSGLGSPLDKFLYPLTGLARALRLPRADLVHAIMVNAAAVAARAYLRFGPSPSLLTLQDGDSEEYARSYLGPLFPIYPRLHRPFDRIHAISHFLERQAIRYGADPSIIDVIPNGVDTDLFRAIPNAPERVEELRRSLDLSRKRVIVSVSRLVQKNGIDTLLDAVPEILRSHPTAVVVLVGDGSDRRSLEARAERLGVRHAVRFVGAVDHRETPDYLHLADAFVRPSRSEGLGTAFLEAMACGIPVVATPAGGIPDFIQHDVNGLLVQPGSHQEVAQATSRILGDPATGRRLSRAADLLVRSGYQWDSIAERIGDLYDELLNP